MRIWGDARLNARRDRVIAALEQHPDTGFPEACASDAETEALYRFLRNRRVSLDAVIAPQVQAHRRPLPGGRGRAGDSSTPPKTCSPAKRRAPAWRCLARAATGSGCMPRWRSRRTACGPRWAR